MNPRMWYELYLIASLAAFAVTLSFVVEPSEQLSQISTLVLPIFVTLPLPYAFKRSGKFNHPSATAFVVYLTTTLILGVAHGLFNDWVVLIMFSVCLLHTWYYTRLYYLRR